MATVKTTVKWTLKANDKKKHAIYNRKAQIKQNAQT